MTVFPRHTSAAQSAIVLTSHLKRLFFAQNLKLPNKLKISES